MLILKCKICGGDMSISPDKTFGICEYCGNTMTLPRIDDGVRAAAFNRGNHFRRTGEFDKALQVYEKIVEEDPSDAEAHWCCALCRFGIEWVEDPATMEYLPTCHRASFDPFTEDVDYKAAIELSEGLTKRQYMKDGAKIAEVQKGILATSQNEEPFDVFICYKESDDQGNRTVDSTLAQDVYYQLTDQGLRTFFARITLEDKVGSEYEPYIFAALNSAKAMVVIGTKPEHFNAVWVKNEWSRYLAIVKRDRSKVLLPCYRDMDPYDLPEQLSILQSYDMSKIGFIQDLIRGIKKIVQTDEPKATVKETVVVSDNANTLPLLRRAFMYLEDGQWKNADEYCERVLDLDPENAQAYLGKLMAEQRVHKQDDLADCALPFDGSNNFKKAIRFGDQKVAYALNGYIQHINDRNEKERLEGIYNRGMSAMKAANDTVAFSSAADIFKTIPGYKDADALIEKCYEEAETCRKDAIYMTGVKTMNARAGIAEYEAAIKVFSTIPGWKDSDDRVLICQGKIEEIKKAEEAERLRRKLQVEEARVAAEKAKKKRKKIIAIMTPSVLACVGFAVILITIIIPKTRYNKAVALIDSGHYDEAYDILEKLGHKDQIARNKYDRAMGLIASEEYEEAYALLEEIETKEAKEAIASSKYDRAMELIASEKYEAAYALLEEIGTKEAKETIASNKYDRAMALIDSSDYKEAYDLLLDLDYKDSAVKLKTVSALYRKEVFEEAGVGGYVTFGSYEQDNDKSNGKEDIEWQILAQDGEKVLLISRYALDCLSFNRKNDFTTWEECSLREWLNGTFFNSAFSTEEKLMIQNSTVEAKKNATYNYVDPGNDTNDRIFLLSSSESYEYFSSDEMRKCQGTLYCSAQGAKTDENGFCNWWMRTPGAQRYKAAYINNNGSAINGGAIVNNDDYAVRPVLWITLK